MMRRLILLVLFSLLLARPASAAITILASGGAGSSNNTVATSTAVNTSGATFLLVACSWYDATVATPTIADSKGNTWTGLTKKSNGGGGGSTASQIFYVNSATPTVGADHTFSCTAEAPTVLFVVANATTATPFDNESGSLGNGTSRQPGAITPSANNALVVNVAGGLQAGALSIDAGTIQFQTANSAGAHVAGAIATLLQTTAASSNPLWTWSGSVANTAVQASFKFDSTFTVATGKRTLLGVGK